MSYTMTSVSWCTAWCSSSGSAGCARYARGALAHRGASTDPATVTATAISRSRMRPLLLVRSSTPCQGARSAGAEDQRTVVVPGHDDQLPLAGPDRLNVARLSGHEEATLRRPHRRKLSRSVAAQQQPVTRVHPPDLRLDAVEVPGQQQIGLPVPVEVARQDPVDGGELRLERQRHQRERAVAVVARQRGGEGARLFD